MNLIKIILIVFIVLICYFLNIRIFNIKKFKNEIKNYVNALIKLKELIIDKNKNIKSKDLEKRLNKISSKGLILLLGLFKILLPYLLCFFFIFFLKLNIPIFLISILAFTPYLSLIKR